MCPETGKESQEEAQPTGRRRVMGPQSCEGSRPKGKARFSPETQLGCGLGSATFDCEVGKIISPL